MAESIDILLANASTMENWCGRARRNAELQVLTAMCRLAFPTAGATLARARELDSWNPRILRLIRSDKSTKLVQWVDRPTGQPFPLALEFGRWEGCTVVYPLTASGWEKLRNSNASGGDLGEADIVGGDGQETTSGDLYLGSVVSTSALNEGATLNSNGTRVVRNFLAHICEFLPRLKWQGESRVVSSTPGVELPRLMATPYNERTRLLLVEYGFEPVGVDRLGREKLAAEFRTYNEAPFEERGRGILRAIRNVMRMHEDQGGP